MRKMYLMISLAGMVSMMVLTGCKKQEADSETLFPPISSLETTAEVSAADFEDEAAPQEEETKEESFEERMARMAETTAADHSIAAIENEEGEIEYRLGPTEFLVYHDGEPHQLMYGANAYKYFYDNFRAVSLPEWHVEEISLPTVLADQMKDPVVIEKGNMMEAKDYEYDVLYDTSARYSTEEIPVYSIESNYMIFRAWKAPYSGDPTAYTREELIKAFPNEDQIYGFEGDGPEWKHWQESDGSHRYSTIVFQRDYTGPHKKTYMLHYTVINKDGMAYYFQAGCSDPESAYWFGDYVLRHSFYFKE